MFIDYIKYLFKANNAHSIHSPFVFDFYNNVFKKNAENNVFIEIENIRSQNLNDTTKINIHDFGAGSKHTKNNQREIANIAKYASKKKKWALLLYKIIKHYQYSTIIDLGTSLGFTTAYISAAAPKGQITTFEGCEETKQKAIENLNNIGLKNVNFVLGDISKTLKSHLEKIDKIDFAFFDANHQYQPTIEYFELCLTKAHENSCFVFDDIYWSHEMKLAWKEIIQNSKVSISINLFYVGIVFFRKGIAKEHFILK